MPEFLRVVQKARWYLKPEWDGWRQGDLQGDALNDLQTKGNALSVYSVGEGAEIGRIIAALAANRDHLSHLDYVVFDGTSLASSNILVLQTDGQTPDREVNNVHHDVVNLTVSRLLQVAQIVSGCERVRITKSQMKARLKQAMENQWLDSDKVNGDVLRKLS
jgi:hypothetical protein